MRKIRLVKTYDGITSEKMSLEIDKLEKEPFQVKINDDVYCEIKYLEWLRDAIDEAFSFMNKKLEVKE